MRQTPKFLGLDVGGTKSAALIGTDKGEVLEREEIPSNAQRGPQAMIGDLVDCAQRLLKKHDVLAGGVSIGGPLDANRGLIYSPPNLPGWDALPLKELLSQKLGLPIFVEHDAAACALAEYVWGDAGNLHALVYLTCGTGFGAGLVIDGKIYRGAGGRSMEIGHARFAEHGPVAYGKAGSIESFCSGNGLGLLAQWKFPARWGMAAPSGKELFDLSVAGDADAASILQLSAESLGQVCANIADFLLPDVIAIGSLARYCGEGWMKMVIAKFNAEVHPEARQHCHIKAASLGARLQDLSALVVAMKGAKS